MENNEAGESRNETTDWRRRRRAEEVEELLREYEGSGESQVEYARRRGINVGTLRQWIYRRRREKGEGDSGGTPPGFASVRLGMGGAGIIVRCAGGVEVELPCGTPVGVVCELVRGLLG